jgi:hypothetical protein
MKASHLDFDHLLELRLAVARFGEVDLPRWWNTNGQLGSLGAMAAVAEARRLVEGERLATIRLGTYFGAGVETVEQLEAALAGIREECARFIGAGKKVVVV